MSTPNLQGESSYRYESVYAFFPKHTVEAAGGESRRVTFQMNSRTAYATHPRSSAHILRRATCRIPDTDKAERLLRTRLEQFPSPPVDQQSNAERPIGNLWSGVPDSSSVHSSGPSTPSSPNSKGLECANYSLTLDYCVTVELEDGSKDTLCFYEVECTAYKFVREGDSGGGGGGDDTGDDPSECNTDGGASGQLCGGGGATNPVDSDVNLDPCELDNPPDYCDEAGSCYDQNFENKYDQAIIQALESKGALNELWKKSNADAADQSKREERGGWIVSTDDGYKLVEFHEAEDDITYTPLGVEGVTTGNRPSGTVATFHTQPFEPGEAITDTDVIQQYLDENDLNDQYDAESITPKYPSKPSKGDFGAANTLNMKGYLTDGSTVYSYDDVRGVDTAVGRCGY
jgi:hypothetical protein